MTGPNAGRSGEALRVYFRVPTNLEGRIAWDGETRSVRIVDLSTTGLAFLVQEGAELPPLLQIEFRLSRFRKALRAGVQVKNQVPKDTEVRVGCFFTDLSDEDRAQIQKFILSRSEVFATYRALLNASFGVSLVAVLKELMLALLARSAATAFGRSVGLASGAGPDAVKTLVCLAFSLTSFFVIQVPKKVCFLLANLALGGAWLVLTNLVFSSVRRGLWDQAPPEARGFLVADALVWFYTGFSLVRSALGAGKFLSVRQRLQSHARGGGSA